MSAIFQLSVLLQAAGGQGPPGYEYAAESDPLLDGLLAVLSTLGSLLYLAFLFWMVFECLRQDPDRWLWVWVMLLLQPFGPFVYFFARWLPGKQLRLPAGLRRFTRGKELSRLEVAARQIGNPHQFVQWADALRDVRKYDQAARAYATALEREPDHLQALWGAALVDITQEQYESAESRLRRVLELDPQYKFGDVSLEFGKVLCRLRRNDEATAHLEQHVNRWRHPEALYRLAELAVARNDSASARRWLQEMLLDIEGSPKGIARKYTMWKSRARRLLRKLPAS